MTENPDVATLHKPAMPHEHDDTCLISPDRRVERNGRDSLGDMVERVLVGTEHFIIYSVVLPRRRESTSDEGIRPIDPAKDHLWLRSVLPDTYECAKAFRINLSHVASDLAHICDVVDDVCSSGSLSGDRSASMRRRSIEMMARAMQMAFEGQIEAARKLLERVRDQVTTLRDSKNRMYYILANLGSLFLLLLAWALLQASETSFLSEIKVGDATTDPLNVLALGAIGSFFSVSTTIASIRVDHSITWLEMLYAGAVRVPVGIIAAAVTVLLISGGWILGSLDEEAIYFSYLLFGFLAGFSEMFVPNVLKQTEGVVTVSDPSSIESYGQKAAS